MAYNSDGYIMIDFTEVDFRRTNQTIEGLFDRCQKVIGTNKFVIVINANNKTPLPSTVCITNGQYVIESVLYTFAISSNDNLHITKKTTPEELIDDNHITLKTTWSSYLISTLLEQVSIKSFTYVGNDNVVNTISFPKTPSLVFIQGNSTNSTAQSGNILYGISKGTTYEAISLGSPGTSLSAARSIDITYDGNDLILTGGSAARALNSSGVTYTVYYI